MLSVYQLEISVHEEDWNVFPQSFALHSYYQNFGTRAQNISEWFSSRSHHKRRLKSRKKGSSSSFLWSWSLRKCLFRTVSISLSGEVLERGVCRFLSQQKVMIPLKYHPSSILVVVHNSCDIKVCSFAFISWFINLYVHVVNVDLTKPLSKYAGNSPVLLPLYAALQICLINNNNNTYIALIRMRSKRNLFSNSVFFLGPATYSM